MTDKVYDRTNLVKKAIDAAKVAGNKSPFLKRGKVGSIFLMRETQKGEDAVPPIKWFFCLGVKYIVFGSAAGAQHEAITFGKEFRDAERYLEASGITFTILRMAPFVENILLSKGVWQKKLISLFSFFSSLFLSFLLFFSFFFYFLFFPFFFF